MVNERGPTNNRMYQNVQRIDLSCYNKTLLCGKKNFMPSKFFNLFFALFEDKSQNSNTSTNFLSQYKITRKTKTIAT